MIFPELLRCCRQRIVILPSYFIQVSVRLQMALMIVPPHCALKVFTHSSNGIILPPSFRWLLEWIIKQNSLRSSLTDNGEPGSADCWLHLQAHIIPEWWRYQGKYARPSDAYPLWKMKARWNAGSRDGGNTFLKRLMRLGPLLNHVGYYHSCETAN